MGRRNLLTTASNGSANGLQVISDRLADNFSILPGHHGTGDNGDDGGEGNDGGVSGDDEDEAEEEGDGGGIMSKSFAMFECSEEGAQSQSVRTSGGREREPSLFLPLCQSVFVHHPHTDTRAKRQSNFDFCSFYCYNGDQISRTCPVSSCFPIKYTTLSTEVNLSRCVGGSSGM